MLMDSRFVEARWAVLMAMFTAEGQKGVVLMAGTMTTSLALRSPAHAFRTTASLARLWQVDAAVKGITHQVPGQPRLLHIPAQG